MFVRYHLIVCNYMLTICMHVCVVASYTILTPQDQNNHRYCTIIITILHSLSPNCIIVFMGGSRKNFFRQAL